MSGLVGLVVGFGAYLLTAAAPQMAHFPECVFTQVAGFDPWTGLPHGATLECSEVRPDGSHPIVTQDYPVPDDLAARRAIPVPMGFAAGALLVLAASTLGGVWRRRPKSP